VLDNAATDHICNDLSRLEDFRPSTVTNKLEAGTQTLDIQGYGTAYITVQTLLGPYKLRLNDVAYIPGYTTNIVCFRRFHQRGIQWDTARTRLIDENGAHICSLQDRHGLWLLEYNPLTTNGSQTSGGGSPPPSPPAPPSNVEQAPTTALATTKRSKRSQQANQATNPQQANQATNPQQANQATNPQQANQATNIPTAIPTATIIDPIDPEEEEEQQGFSTDESDDEPPTSHNDVDVTTYEPVSGDPNPPTDLPTCLSDDVDPSPGVQLPLTPRPTPEQDGQAPPGHLGHPPGHSDRPPGHSDRPPGHSDRPPGHSDRPPGHPDHLPHHPASTGHPGLLHSPNPPDLTPAEPHQPKRTGKKDPAPRYSEISANTDRPELIIPQRTRGDKRKEAYALAVVKIGHNTGFHSALAAGASQAHDRQHQSTLLPELSTPADGYI
jgi:hypothetical protein